MPFAEAHTFIECIKKSTNRFVITRNMYYGIHIWGSSDYGVDYEPLIDLFKTMNIPANCYGINNNRGEKFVFYNFYVAFSEFDKEV